MVYATYYTDVISVSKVKPATGCDGSGVLGLDRVANLLQESDGRREGHRVAEFFL